MMEIIRCQKCQSPYPTQGLPYLCPACGGVYDLSTLPLYQPDLVDNSFSGIWKYQHTFGMNIDPSGISLGEGSTALVWDSYQGKSIGYKLEYQNPTGSYKDRATAVLTAQLKARNVHEAVEDSSGNAGASFAAYAAKSNIHATVYVPSSASGPKLRQIVQYGADLVPVEGPRSEAARLVREAANQGTPYASHAYLPFGMLGIATIAYELLEQTNMQIGTVIAPVGHGSLFLGIIRGFQALAQAGSMKELPIFIGVQAANCAPIYSAYSHKPTNDLSRPTVAEGVRVTTPVRGEQILEQLNKNNGKIVAIEEESILSSRSQLAIRGINVEPTSALVWSALKHEINTLVEPIILILSGSGYKYSSQ